MTPEFFKLYRGTILGDGRVTNRATSRVLADPWTADRRFDYDQWDEILSRTPEDNFPNDIFELSDIRKNTNGEPAYKLWDFIVGNERAPGITDYGKAVRLDEVPPARPGGDWWPSVYKLYVRGDLSPVHPYVVDMQNNALDRFLLNAAHTLTHMRTDKVSTRASMEEQYERCSWEFLQAIADVTVARAYGLPIDTTADNRLPYGIVAVPTLRFGFGDNTPVLTVPHVVKGSPYVDKAMVAISVVIEVGPDPINMLMPSAEAAPYNDWWSYQPMRMYILGWETMAFVTSGQTVRVERVGKRKASSLAYGVHYKDLFAPDSFRDYVSHAKGTLGTPGNNFHMLRDWMKTAEFIKEEHSTPMLPCVNCFLKNPATEGGLIRPQGIAPKRWKDDAEWTSYMKRFKDAYKFVGLVKKAQYGKLYVSHRADRRRAYEGRLKYYREQERKKKRW